MIQNLLQLDSNFFHSLNSLLGASVFFDATIKFFAVYLVYLVPIGLLIAWFMIKKDVDKINLIKIALVSIVMFQIPTRIIAAIWYRPRPIIDLAGSKEVVFHVPSYSFPSDHSTFFAAFATYFYLCGYKTIGIILYIATFLVGISRIIGGLHYPGDVLGGWILGIFGAWLIYKLLDKYIQKYLAQPILKFMKMIRLA